MKRRCGCCHKTVSLRNVANAKARVRHKCPHGLWCITGNAPQGLHANWPTCSGCLIERKSEEASKLRRENIEMKKSLTYMDPGLKQRLRAAERDGL